MAKAGDKSSTTDRIFLSKALALAVRRFGTETLAKRRLREWLKSGELPWSSRDWYGPDAETIARLARENAESKDVGYFDPSGPYRQDDPEFWGAPTLDIKWQENKASEAARGGAVAEGIWVTYSRLLALLPEKLRKRKKTPGPAKAVKMGPQKWLASTREKHPQRPGEQVASYRDRLLVLMQEAKNVTKVWSPETLRRRLYK